MTETTEKSAPPRKRRAGAFMLWVVAPALIFVFYESIVLLGIGMIPTGIALFVDRSPHKDQARSVGYLNFAGCLPWAVDFWLSGGGFDHVFEILGQPLVLVMMYASAAAGWALCFIVRPFVAAYLSVAADIREGQLKKRRSELAEEWGEEVRAAASDEAEALEGD